MRPRAVFLLAAVILSLGHLSSCQLAGAADLPAPTGDTIVAPTPSGRSSSHAPRDQRRAD